MGIARFEIGRVVGTPGALHALREAAEDPVIYLIRHSRGDWGELCEEDKQQNDAALTDGTRLMSAYTLATGEKIWIITEADRSSTTILLPDDY